MTSGLSLVLVRHGETEWMERGLLHGRLDSPLSPTGRRHARQAAQRLRGETFDALYASPLGRAMETAAILGGALGLAAQPIDDLAELDFGWLEGSPALLWRGDGLAGAALRPVRALAFALTAERPAAFRRRVTRALAWIVDRHASGRLLVVAHHAVLSRLMGVMMAAPERAWRDFGPLTACGISEVRRSAHSPNGREPGWEIVVLNDESHLLPEETR